MARDIQRGGSQHEDNLYDNARYKSEVLPCLEISVSGQWLQSMYIMYHLSLRSMTQVLKSSHMAKAAIFQNPSKSLRFVVSPCSSFFHEHQSLLSFGLDACHKRHRPRTTPHSMQRVLAKTLRCAAIALLCHYVRLKAGAGSLREACPASVGNGKQDKKWSPTISNPDLL